MSNYHRKLSASALYTDGAVLDAIIAKTPRLCETRLRCGCRVRTQPDPGAIRGVLHTDCARPSTDCGKSGPRTGDHDHDEMLWNGQWMDTNPRKVSFGNPLCGYVL